MIASTEIHDVEVRIEVLMMRRRMMNRRVVHRWRKLQVGKNRNWLSYPKRIKRRKHIVEGQIVVDLDAFVAFSTSQKASVVEHVFGEWVERPEVAFARIPGLARYFDEAIVETVAEKEVAIRNS